MLTKKPRKIDRAFLDEIKKENCRACGDFPTDPAHIRSKGAGGPDESFNVIALCRRHHTEQHQRGWWDFLSNKPILWFWMQSIGWQWLDGKLWNDRLR